MLLDIINKIILYIIHSMLRMSIGNVHTSYYCTCHYINKLFYKIITDLLFTILFTDVLFLL